MHTFLNWGSSNFESNQPCSATERQPTSTHVKKLFGVGNPAENLPNKSFRNLCFFQVNDIQTPTPKLSETELIWNGFLSFFLCDS